MTHEDATTWTRQDLELYHDGALDETTAERLSAALRESPALRARLARVSRADALAREALAMPIPRVRPSSRRLIGAAAILAVMVTIAALALERHAREGPPGASVVAHRSTAAKAGVTDRMVVFSFPVRQVDAGERKDEPEKARVPSVAAAAPESAAPAPAMSPRRYEAALDAALSRGDAAGAAELLDTPDAAMRELGYRRLGTVLRSVTTARRVLEELPVDSRLAACRELVFEPRWRTVTCAQLVMLREDPAMRKSVDALLAELAKSPELAPLIEQVRTPRTPVGSVPDRSL